jgi:hypothetical protein
MSPSAMHRTLRRSLVLSAIGAALAAGVSGCGGSTVAARQPVQQGRATAQSNDDSFSGETRAAAAPRGRVSVAQATSHPCALVSQAELGALAGATVIAQAEAPLGPTCVFRLSGARIVTLALQQQTLSAAAAALQHQAPARAGRHPAVCGLEGRPLLYAPVAPKLVLQISAPCQAAERIAARVISHLSA